MKNKLPIYLNIFLCLITLFSSLQIKLDPPIWLGYGDPYDYLEQSKIPLTDIHFYIPKHVNFYPRPFTVPLIYKIVNGNPESIIIIQKIIHFLSAFIFASVLLLYIKRSRAKIFFLISWYLLMIWWNILGWTNNILSESLSISFLFLWFSSFLYFEKKKNNITLILHSLVTILFSFTRDSWPYILIAFYTIYILYSLLWEKRIKISYSIFLTLSIILFITQQYTAKVGQRYRRPVLNNIVYRILPNEKYTQWFVENGMPCKDILIQKNINFNDYKAIYSLYNDTSLNELHRWAIEKGNVVYMKFLITHPKVLLLLNEKRTDLNRIFAYDFGYTGDIRGISYISFYIFPFFSLLSVILLLFFICYISFRENINQIIFSITVIIIFTLNAFLLYSADALEVERHLFLTNIMIQFSGIYLITFILDSKTFDLGRE